MTSLLGLSLILLSISTVHCGWFDGIRNCRTTRCSFKVGTTTIRSWSTRLCGHSCGTVHQRVPESCLTTGHEAMCNADTFRSGTPGRWRSWNGSVWVQRFQVTKLFTTQLILFMVKSPRISVNPRSAGTSRARLTAGMPGIPPAPKPFAA